MINLISNIERSTARPVVLTAVAETGLRYPARLAEIRPFLSALSATDRKTFDLRATFSIDNPNRDTRSLTIPLAHTIEIEGQAIRALRLKGVFPRADQNGKVGKYDRGRGFCSKALFVSGPDELSCRPKLMDADYLAAGTVKLNTLSNEVLAALAIGAETTDMILGFGLYQGLNYDDQPVGFAIYGMGRDEDLRLNNHIVTHIKYLGDLPGSFPDLIRHVGKLLRKVHASGHSHGSGYASHIGNFGVLPPSEARIVDLDASLSLRSIPAEHRLAVLYLDIQRIVKDLIFTKFRNHYSEDVSLAPYLPHFFMGYFGTFPELSFVRSMERIARSPIKEERDFQCSHSGFSVALPGIELTNHEGSGIVDLASFRSDPIFNDFYCALESATAI
ncbi:MAG TPA: hypothetical protein VMD02_07340 [Candidatus Omnitrophota bacterium]|nr:hypothetical protein [Candidatus Omnitrophota bacterium]